MLPDPTAQDNQQTLTLQVTKDLVQRFPPVTIKYNSMLTSMYVFDKRFGDKIYFSNTNE